MKAQPQSFETVYRVNNVTLLGFNRKQQRNRGYREEETERWAPDGLAGREVVAMAHRRAAVPTELVSQHHLWRAALRSPCSLHARSTPAALCNCPLSFSSLSVCFTPMLLYCFPSFCKRSLIFLWEPILTYLSVKTTWQVDRWRPQLYFQNLYCTCRSPITWPIYCIYSVRIWREDLQNGFKQGTVCQIELRVLHFYL